MLLRRRHSASRLAAGERQHLNVNAETEQDERRHDDDVLGAIRYRRATDGVPVQAVGRRPAARQTVEVEIRLVVVGRAQVRLRCECLQTAPVKNQCVKLQQQQQQTTTV